MNRSELPSPSCIARTIEISAAAGLGVTAIVLLAVYLTRTDIDPHTGNVMLTAAGVTAVIAVVLAVHWDLRNVTDKVIYEQHYQRMYTMIDRAESIESGRDDTIVTDIDKHHNR